MLRTSFDNIQLILISLIPMNWIVLYVTEITHIVSYELGSKLFLIIPILHFMIVVLIAIYKLPNTNSKDKIVRENL